MKSKDLISLTLTSLKSNPLRSFLSSLGVFMGVFAISGTLQVSDIGQSFIKRELEAIESPQILIGCAYNPLTYDCKYYTPEDLELLKTQLSGWRYITSIENMYGNTIYYNNEKINVESQAVSHEFLSLSGRQLILGSFFDKNDLKNARPVAVIDQFLAQKLFRGQNPLNKILYFGNKSYYIKGVIQTKKSNQWSDTQGLILIPLSVHQSLNSSNLMSQIVISPQDGEDLEKIKNQAIELLKQRFSGSEIWGYSNIEDLKMFEKLLFIVAIVLLLIGGIALLVGGIGIANITIASVTERTSEIGLKRAIGATKKDILIQFLLESTLISITGGMIAIITVQAVSIIAVIILELPYQFNYRTPLISLSSAIMIGIVSSFLPAQRASNLDPVEALRN
jgi:putative ABC transport system permease protein